MNDYLDDSGKGGSFDKEKHEIRALAYTMHKADFTWMKGINVKESHKIKILWNISWNLYKDLKD